MKISYNWLKQFIDTDWSPEKTGELLTDLGLEIEGVEAFSSVQGGLQGIVVGEVLTCEQHPNADRLNLTTVNIGADEPVQIVCGAPNVAAGQKVPVATIGTTLYSAEGEPWTIKKGKIRGEVSMGMICAEDELGLGQSHDGIMVLDAKLIPGTPAADVFEVENDQVFEIGLTPNRADAMSHWGVARDLKAGMQQQGETKELITPGTTSFHVDNRSLKIDVEVEDKERAPRYCGVTISGLKVGESPAWLQNRLKAIGLSPINNVVDVTNYVLHELGQPLHAFDAAKVSGNKVVVKTVAAGTKFTTLDEVERELHEEDLMICDAEKPMCIAGVFGGIDSGVTAGTTSIFLESAYFDPVSVRKTAKRHGLNTDASFRFERGIDPNITEYALMRAAILLEEVAGGVVTSDIIDIYPNKVQDHEVVLNFDKAKALIGEEIPRETIKSILTSLDIKIQNVTESGIGMLVPAYRNDVTREVDIIEEILRVYGYNNIGFTSKLNASIAQTAVVEDHKLQDKAGNHLTALGFHEMLNNSLGNPAHNALTDSIDDSRTIGPINPLSTELGALRQHMLFGALESAAYNLNRKQSRIQLFEFGKTYHQYESGRQEQNHLALTLVGDRHPSSWNVAKGPTDFFYGKGVVASLLDTLGVKGFGEKALEDDCYSEGIRWTLGKKELVRFGVISKKLSKAFGLDQQVLFADFDWDAIVAAVPTTNFLVAPIPKYPKVKRDFALLLDDAISFGELQQAAFQTEKQLLKDVSLFDVYTGKNLPEGKKSYALSFTLLDERKTLTDKQIDKIMGKLQQRFEKDFGASLR